MRDPYDVLGVSKSAGAAEIKSAFRKHAKKLHPDANKHDPKAATRFAELNAAYEILGEEDKRKAFDRGEIDAEGKPRFQGFEGFGAGAGRAAASAARAISRPSPGGRTASSAERPRRRRRRRLRGHPARRHSAAGAARRALGPRRRRVRAGRFRPASAATAAIFPRR